MLRTGRLGAHDGRARSKQRVAAGASPKGEASAALKRRGTACQAGDGAAITPLSRLSAVEGPRRPGAPADHPLSAAHCPPQPPPPNQQQHNLFPLNNLFNTD